MLSPKAFHALIALAVATTIALAGCGGGDEEAASPLDEALGYLPEDAGFAVVASTDPGDYDDARKLVEKFPFGGRVEDALRQSLEQEGVNFEDDIEPLLGNELVIGTDENERLVSGSDETPVIVALETQDSDKLKQLVEKNAEGQGEAEGYDLYQGQDDEETWIGVKDEVVVMAEGEDRLRRALEQRGEDDRLTEDDLGDAFEGLPEDAPVDVYVNVQSLLEADPEAAKDALKVKWVESLQTLGFTADVTEDGVVIDQFTRTDAEGLADEDLPLPPGDETPRILERDDDAAEVVIGLRDPSHVIDFAIAALKAVRPADHAQFQAGVEAAGQRLDVDIEADVFEQLSGDATGAVRLDGSFGVRAELADARAFRGTLDKLMDGLPDFADGVRVTPPRGGFYGVATPEGKTFAVGVADDALVVASDTALANDVATRELVEAEGEGALVMSADAEKLANEALAQFAGGAQALGGSLFTGPLGALLSSAAASTDGLTGRTELEVD